MNDKEREEMICKLAEQLSGDDTTDFALKAMIKAMLEPYEYIEVITRYKDNGSVLRLGAREREGTHCVYRKEQDLSNRYDHKLYDDDPWWMKYIKSPRRW